MECGTKTVRKDFGMRREFIKSLSNIYKNDFLSDITLRIIEGTADETDKLNESEFNGNKYYSCNKQVSFPVHKLVLCLNSKFFAKQLEEKNEKEIILNANPGESEYVELLIHSFYDFDLLNNIGLSKLLKVLEIGDRYMCDTLLKQGSAMVEYISVATIDECNSVLDRLTFFKSSLGHVLSKDFFDSCCSQYLTKLFTPLECIAFDELPNKLHFSSLLMLLKSNDGFAYHENSVMTFVLNWLEADESRQTEQNIEALLAECRYEHMDVPFLTTGLSHTNPILCKWSGFLNWYVKAIAYPSSTKRNNQLCKRLNRSIINVAKVQPNFFSNIPVNPLGCKEKSVKGFPNTETKITFDFGTAANALQLWSFKSNEKSVCQEYNLTMEFNKDKKKWTSDKWIMYNGYILQPAITLYGNENKVMLEMYLGKEDQERELKDFDLEISIRIGLSPKNQKNVNSTRQYKMEFLERNRAETSIDYISHELCEESCYVCHLFL